MTRLLLMMAACAAIPAGGCKSADAPQATATAAATIPLTVATAGGTHRFRVEVARTPAEQERGLMFRPPLPADGGMLFAPYPADGGAPRIASFWMKDTPSALDIVFIRADRTIAGIAENTTPFSQTPVTSGEPVAAVLELRGGRAAELGLDEGDRVDW